jgi:hypothetical protein
MIHIVGINIGTKYQGYTEPWLRGLERCLQEKFIRTIITEDPNLKGWWPKLRLFDPDNLNFGKDEVIYFFDIDIVFLRDLDSLLDHADSLDAPIVGIKDYMHPVLNSSFMRIDRASDAAARVWKLAIKNNFHMPRGGGDQDLTWEAAKDDIAFLPDYMLPSYKVMAGLWPVHGHKQFTHLHEACGLVFHGKPNPHEILQAEKHYPYRTLIQGAWK